MIAVVDGQGYVNLHGPSALWGSQGHGASTALGHVHQMYPQFHAHMTTSVIGLLKRAKSILSKHLAENVLESSTMKIKIHWLWLGIVVGLAPLRVAQDVRGLLYFLETCLLTDAVGMMLHGQFAIGAFDFFAAGTA